MPGADAAASSSEGVGPRDDERADPLGCLIFGVRYIGCALTLYILMFAAILVAALVGTVLFGG